MRVFISARERCPGTERADTCHVPLSWWEGRIIMAHVLLSGSRARSPVICRISMSTRQPRKSSIGSKKLSSLHILKYLAVATLSVVAGCGTSTKEGFFDAYRTNCAADRSHPAQALWRYRAGGVLADGGVDRARPRRDAVCQRRFGDVGAAGR